MVRVTENSSDGNLFVRIVENINEKFEHVLGSPPRTAMETEVSVPALAPCPLCGHPMGQHQIDHSVSNAVLHCPVPDAERRPSPASHEPLGELGMPASARRIEHLRERGEL